VSRLNAEAALRAIAHPKRRQMLELVWDGERTATDLAVRCRMSRPAASQHLKVLRQANLVTVRAEGTHRFYRVRADRVAELASILDRFWGDRLARLQEDLTLLGEEPHQ
jgi:DNA-binding transcriptional ArsR family regulator